MITLNLTQSIDWKLLLSFIEALGGFLGAVAAILVVCLTRKLWWLERGQVNIVMRMCLNRVELGYRQRFEARKWPADLARIGGGVNSTSSFEQSTRGAGELLEVVLENPGRHPITVHSYGLGWRKWRWRYLRWQHNSATPFLLMVDGDSKFSSKLKDSIRLEPGERVTLEFDVWSSLIADRKRLKSRKVRFVARVVERGDKVYQSKSSWRIKSTDFSFQKNLTEMSISEVVERTLLSHPLPHHLKFQSSKIAKYVSQELHELGDYVEVYKIVAGAVKKVDRSTDRVESLDFEDSLARNLIAYQEFVLLKPATEANFSSSPVRRKRWPTYLYMTRKVQ